MLALLKSDVRAKAVWVYGDASAKNIIKALLSDGTGAMILYRLMQWSRRRKLLPLELLANRLNTVFNDCIIGRGAEFGPGFVLVHCGGVVINGAVRGGEHVVLEHQVTVGAERRLSPQLGDRVFVGAGAKVIGAVVVGSDAKIGANAVVVKDVPSGCTVVGVPARIVRGAESAPLARRAFQA
jgi:serine O-acetyltransferase